VRVSINDGKVKPATVMYVGSEVWTVTFEQDSKHQQQQIIPMYSPSDP
jgi:hypothetical protein